MASLKLPRPMREYVVHSDASNSASSVLPGESSSNPVPKYRFRKGYLPRNPEDFGDGGAFPEIHVAQYPLGLGKKGSQKSKSLALTADEKGRANLDSIVKRENSNMQTRYSDVVAKNSTAETNELLKLPSSEEEASTLAKTQASLAKLLNQKRGVTQKDSGDQVGKYIEYSTDQSKSSSSEQKRATRVIRLVDAAVDPLEPPKFKHKKQPKAAMNEQLAPVLHAPDEKLSEEDRKNWVIPPCISSWKNRNGYTIPLDKRLAADGRGLEQMNMSDRFAGLSEALYLAENQARQEIEARNREKQFLLQKEKEKREQELRELAMQARMQQSGHHVSERPAAAAMERGREPERGRQRSESESSGSSGTSRSQTPPRRRDRSETPPRDDRNLDIRGGHRRDVVDAEERERDRIRRDQKRKRERMLRLEAAGKKSKLSRDGERDISERIALGMAVPKTAQLSGEAQYDSRLFNQSSSSTAGFGPEDGYNIYEKPLFEQTSNRLYRPKASEESGFGSAAEQLEKLKRSDRFRPAKDFEGVDRSKPGRSGPVQFERGAPTMKQDEFSFLADASSQARNVGAKMDDVLGKGRTGMGVMAASGGADLESARIGSGRSKIQFQKGSN